MEHDLLLTGQTEKEIFIEFFMPLIFCDTDRGPRFPTGLLNGDKPPQSIRGLTRMIGPDLLCTRRGSWKDGESACASFFELFDPKAPR